MAILIEINGLDESGRVGETIWLVRTGIRIDSEIQILLRNLEHFDKLIVRKDDLHGREEKNLMKYVRDAIDDPSLEISIFKMRVQTQVRVLKEYFAYLSEDMFKARKILIDELLQTTPNKPTSEENKEREERTDDPMWQVADSLKRFEGHPFMIESAVKSYGMMNLTAKLDRISNLFRTTLGAGAKHMLVVQIDGGYPFAFWWKKLVNSGDVANIKKGNVYISGVAKGDCYYPAMSVAGTIANVLNKYPHRTSFFPTNELSYDSKFPVDEEFYKSHTMSLLRPTFGNRIVFVGKIDSELMSYLPYCLHRTDRKKTFEPFHVEISAESFFHKYGYGRPENTLIIFGKMISEQHKKDVWHCKSKGYKYKHLADLKNDFESLCTDIENEIDLLHKEKRVKLAGKFEQLKKRFISDLE